MFEAHNFRVFRGLVRNREKVKGVANRISLIRKYCLLETLRIPRSAKIVRRENLALYSNYYIIFIHVLNDVLKWQFLSRECIWQKKQ